jgi:23S rRNA (uracil1939-C5)-methyltransferase
MGKGRRRLPPFELEVEKLGDRGAGIGLAVDGRLMSVRGAVPGSRVKVQPAGRKKKMWKGRRLHMVRPPADYEEPPCAVFGRCGGCTLQELRLETQRRHKLDFALAAVDQGLAECRPGWRDEVLVHPIRGSDAAYGYRNKIELSFGSRCYLTDAEMAAELPIQGRFIGFHPPGRFDRVVDIKRCWLVGEASNQLLALVSEHLKQSLFEPYDLRSHVGFWRHLLLRESPTTGECLIGLYTNRGTTAPHEEEVALLAKKLLDLELADGRSVAGMVWLENDGVADVARGEPRRIWGQSWMTERLGERRFRLSTSSFFQTSTHGAVVLYDTIREAVGSQVEVLYDLYCGVGSIGLYLSDDVGRIVGIEEHPAAVEDAAANATLNGVHNASYVCARVEEALGMLEAVDESVCLIVDPPRAGLHPKVAKALGGVSTDKLIYVACKPGSLGRDAAMLAAGGWRLAELWAVDLFPQTGHIELVGRFEK